MKGKKRSSRKSSIISREQQRTDENHPCITDITYGDSLAFWGKYAKPEAGEMLKSNFIRVCSVQ